jgi:hypothetical protein
MSRLMSPNELQAAAEKMMLDGRKPETVKDWSLCANFWAANLERNVILSAMPLLGMIFECPLTREELTAIGRFQYERKEIQSDNSQEV